MDEAWRSVLRYAALSHRFHCQPVNECVSGVRVADTMCPVNPLADTHYHTYATTVHYVLYVHTYVRV